MTFDRSTVSAIDTGLRRVLTLGAASVQRLFGLTRLVRHATTGDTDAPAPLDAPQRQTSPLAPALASTDPVSPTRPALRDIEREPQPDLRRSVTRAKTGPAPGARTAGAEHQGPGDAIRAALDFPVLDLSPDSAQSRSVADRFARMAKDGDYSDVLDNLADIDEARGMDTDGTRLASAAVDGVLRALRQALARRDHAIAHSHLLSLEAMMSDHPAHPFAAILLGRAQIDYGWALRGSGYSDEVAPQDWEGLRSHTARAEAVLTAFNPVAEESPLLAATRYLLVRGIADADQRIAGWYGDWVRLDPTDPESHRCHAQYITPQWYGTGAFDVAAREAACRSGAMAYAMYYLSVAEHWPAALAGMDLRLLLQGLAEYTAQTGCQARVNRSAAALWRMSQAPTLGAPGRRAALQKACDAVIRRDLRALHLDCWRDQAEAMAALQAVFGAQIASGARISATATGLRATPIAA